jgi:hypothetical protein
MAPEIQVGTILIKQHPVMAQTLGLRTKPYSSDWGMLQTPDASALEHQIHAAGWNFFFMAAELKTSFFGRSGTQKIHSALQRILKKVSHQHFNGLEVTGIAVRRFLGMIPYTVVSAHTRHIQLCCYLDNTETRRASQLNEKTASA